MEVVRKGIDAGCKKTGLDVWVVVEEGDAKTGTAVLENGMHPGQAGGGGDDRIDAENHSTVCRTAGEIEICRDR